MSRGFTLLELLIVIAIIAILSVALIIVINPAETLKKSRDAQRISDMSTLKTAIGIYTTSTTSPQLGGGTANAKCKPTPTTAWGGSGTYGLYYSLASGSGSITDVALDGSTVVTPALQVATPALTDGTGWIPIPFDNLTGGSPISNLPIDPTNTIAALGGVLSTDLVYRYACAVTPLTYEIDATLESAEYTSGSNNKLTTDGGNSTLYYEVGTNLKVLGAGGSAALDF